MISVSGFDGHTIRQQIKLLCRVDVVLEYKDTRTRTSVSVNGIDLAMVLISLDAQYDEDQTHSESQTPVTARLKARYPAHSVRNHEK